MIGVDPGLSRWSENLAPPTRVDAQLAAVQSMMFDQFEHVSSVRTRSGHDRARHWKPGLDTLVKRGVEKPEVSPETMEMFELVVHWCEASGRCCFRKTW